MLDPHFTRDATPAGCVWFRPGDRTREDQLSVWLWGPAEAHVSGTVDLVTADVAFISLCKVLPAVSRCAKKEADFLVLIKPQFEAGRELVERGGVVRDPVVHQDVIEKIRTFVEKSLNAKWQGVMESPIEGPAGNKEFLAWFKTGNIT